jgi:hypothetical protein
VIGLAPSDGATAELTYSWTGHLRLSNNAGPDPWMLGPTGANFQLQTTVSSAAIDQNSTQTPFADFAAIGSRLWIDGIEVLYEGGAHIDFADSPDVVDAIAASGLFNRNGQSVEIGSVVQLPPATFTFFVVNEVPPVFEPTSTSGLAESIQSPYVASVTAGTLVTIVPEPATPLVLSIVGILFVRHRRRTVVA